MWFGGGGGGERRHRGSEIIRTEEVEEEMAAGDGGGQVVKVKREKLEACMTCPLCNKLLKEATTISLCLHTFCRVCIYEKLSDEEGDCCPVCEIDLGILPVEKLRPDHNLHDIIAKIFPVKGKKVDTPEANKPEANDPDVTPSSLPVKRKERSLSSLVVSAPKVPVQSGMTGKRSRALSRKGAALRGCSFSAEEPAKKDDSTEDHPMSSNSTGNLVEFARNKSQDLLEHSYEQNPNKVMNSDVEITEGKADLWTPLNCLVEAANRTKSSKSNSQGLHATSDPINSIDNELYMSQNKAEGESPNALDCIRNAYTPKTKKKEANQNARGKNNSNGAGASGPVKRKRVRAANQKRVAASGEASASTQPMLDICGAKYRNVPVWFSLVASEDWKGEISLPQISACCLKIKDGKMPVSIIQKYLAMKLELSSENEVEILCRGQPVLPTCHLETLVEMWCRTAPTTKKVPATVGSSAKDFVMVLNYCRRVQNP
ncbi:E3 ubiquitin protein ligase DRIP2-like isoform X1 [Malus sylvestris]|nr:E3 ubiquitin protein ligase DRIP2-like isoform X1 [Malus sylvestris]